MQIIAKTSKKKTAVRSNCGVHANGSHTPN
jgi:hypothetical protein